MFKHREDRQGLTTTLRSLLLFLPSLFGTSDEVLALVLRVVDLLLVMTFLQRPSVPNTVEHASEKSCVSNDLERRVRSQSCVSRMDGDGRSRLGLP